MPRSLLFTTPETKNLRDVGRRLEGVLLEAGFRQVSYLGYECDGFAVLADLERIEADGTPYAGDERFGPSGRPDAFNLTEFISRLFYAPPGYYRQIVFVVTRNVIRESDALPTEGDLQTLVNRGRSALPTAYADVAFETEVGVRALIYEFARGPGDDRARMIEPDGRLSATVHLSKAHIYRALRGR